MMYFLNIGGTYTQIACIKDNTLQQLAHVLTENLRNTLPTYLPQHAHVAIALAYPVSPELETLQLSNNTFTYPIQQFINDFLPQRLLICNDTFAFGCSVMCSQKPSRALCLTIGTGLSGTYILSSQLLPLELGLLLTPTPSTWEEEIAYRGLVAIAESEKGSATDILSGKHPHPATQEKYALKFTYFIKHILNVFPGTQHIYLTGGLFNERSLLRTISPITNYNISIIHDNFINIKGLEHLLLNMDYNMYKEYIITYQR